MHRFGPPSAGADGPADDVLPEKRAAAAVEAEQQAEESSDEAPTSGPTGPAGLVRLLLRSPELGCLALGAMAMGVSSNLLEVAWKSHVHALYPQPSAYAAFMGLVSTVMAAATCALMLVARYMFRWLGWSPTAAAAPRVLLVGGGLFFVTALALNLSAGGPGLLPLAGAGGGGHGVAAAALLEAGRRAPWAHTALQQLAWGGAAIWIVFKVCDLLFLFCLHVFERARSRGLALGLRPDVRTPFRASSV